MECKEKRMTQIPYHFNGENNCFFGGRIKADKSIHCCSVLMAATESEVNSEISTLVLSDARAVVGDDDDDDEAIGCGATSDGGGGVGI